MKSSLLTLAAATFSLTAPLTLDAAPKKVLVVTTTAGFRHSSIETAENVLATLGEQSGAFTVVDFVRGRNDGKDDAAKAANTAALTAECALKMSVAKLNQVDAVIFANTTGDLPLPDKEGFIKWIEAGHALVGMHSCSDTFHGYRPFIDLLGGEFLTHGAQVQIEAYNQDRTFPSNRHLGDAWVIFDEIYEFKSFYRPKVHGLLTLDKSPQTLVPGDFPVAWCKEVGRGGKLWYTSLGHREDVWTSEAYQKHILGGLKWALNLEKAPAKPGGDWNVSKLADTKDGFRPLFDGKTMNGWVYRRPDGNKSWSVQNGMLCNVLKKDEHGTDIYTEEKFRDFIIRGEYQVPPGSNSGLYLRGRHELQIFDNKDNQGHAMGLNGDIYNTASCKPPAPRKAGQWQEIEAKIVGQKITVVLNGVKVHDQVLCERGTGSQLDDNVDQPGPILLQGDHGSVAFRNLRIKKL